jgi:TATA-box binding protein (TBP) (component of TFIID and TFIIIB)
MKFEKLYSLLEESFEDKLKKVFRGTPKQESASEFGLDPEKYVNAAIFTNGDHFLQILMKEDDGKVIVKAGTKGAIASLKASDMDDARKKVREILKDIGVQDKFQIDNKVASCKLRKEEEEDE